LKFIKNFVQQDTQKIADKNKNTFGKSYSFKHGTAHTKACFNP
jgi:hypothetical protein